MAVSTKGTRWIVVDGVTYRWRAICDRCHWDKCDITDVRVVVQAAPPGQLLVSDFMASRYRKDDPLNLPLTPGFARKLILGGLAKGWMPTQRIRKPVTMDEERRRRGRWPGRDDGLRCTRVLLKRS